MRESKSRALTSWLRPNMTFDNDTLAHVDDGVRPHGAAGASMVKFYTNAR